MSDCAVAALCGYVAGTVMTIVATWFAINPPLIGRKKQGGNHGEKL